MSGFEVPQEAVRAAAEAVNAKKWRGEDRPFAAHSGNRFDGGCAVCQGDVEAIVAVAVEAAGPLIAERAREQERARITAALKRAAQGRRGYDKDHTAKPETRLALEAGADAFEAAARLVEDPAVMLGLIPCWMWTPEEEALIDEDRPPASAAESGDAGGVARG